MPGLRRRDSSPSSLTRELDPNELSLRPNAHKRNHYRPRQNSWGSHRNQWHLERGQSQTEISDQHSRRNHHGHPRNDMRQEAQRLRGGQGNLTRPQAYEPNGVADSGAEFSIVDALVHIIGEGEDARNRRQEIQRAAEVAAAEAAAEAIKMVHPFAQCPSYLLLGQETDAEGDVAMCECDQDCVPGCCARTVVELHANNAFLESLVTSAQRILTDSTV